MYFTSSCTMPLRWRVLLSYLTLVLETNETDQFHHQGSKLITATYYGPHGTNSFSGCDISFKGLGKAKPLNVLLRHKIQSSIRQTTR